VISARARNFRAYGDLAAAYEERGESNGTRNRVIRMPSGPAVVITP
jgi:betaine-aldehyde dehydrogenase/5-carboxymethyl-2-hydroxymuconic-semialdehyde dehydrogenase